VPCRSRSFMVHNSPRSLEPHNNTPNGFPTVGFRRLMLILTTILTYSFTSFRSEIPAIDLRLLLRPAAIAVAYASLPFLLRSSYDPSLRASGYDTRPYRPRLHVYAPILTGDGWLAAHSASSFSIRPLALTGHPDPHPNAGRSCA